MLSVDRQIAIANLIRKYGDSIFGINSLSLEEVKFAMQYMGDQGAGYPPPIHPESPLDHPLFAEMGIKF